jgi:serine/threonine protein kinase
MRERITDLKPHVCACMLRVTEKGNYTEKDAASLIKQILEGVAYLHSQGETQAGLCWEMLCEGDQLGGLGWGTH